MSVSTSSQGQYVAYTFHKLDPAWRRLPVDERAAMKDAFAEVIESWSDRFEHLRAYSTAGVRPDCDFFFWKITDRYADLGELGAALNGTPLAGWLETPYSYLATTKASPYTEARRPRKIIPKGSPYLVVYPFVKVRPWYALPLEDRQRAMDEHIRIGREFETIHNHTTYSFGIDDQEFMTAFECDEPSDFMHLMLTLRESEASAYTERDTPIFVGEGMTVRAALDALDGATAQRPRLGGLTQEWGLYSPSERSTVEGVGESGRTSPVRRRGDAPHQPYWVCTCPRGTAARARAARAPHVSRHGPRQGDAGRGCKRAGTL